MFSRNDHVSAQQPLSVKESSYTSIPEEPFSGTPGTIPKTTLSPKSPLLLTGCDTSDVVQCGCLEDKFVTNRKIFSLDIHLTLSWETVLSFHQFLIRNNFISDQYKSIRDI